MPNVAQQRNSEMVALLGVDFLPLTDRNIFGDFYGSVSETITNTPATVTLDTTRNNSETSVFSLNANELTINYPGFYSITYHITAGLNAGSTPGNIVLCWLELNGVEIPASRLYLPIPTAEYVTGSIRLTQQLVVGDTIRIRVQRIAGLDVCKTLAGGKSLQAMCIFSYK